MDTQGALCRYGKAPTKRPTKAPTKRPTKAPTKRPTKAPTKRPNKAPTKRPTKAPTKHPNKAPTKYPIKTPVQYPTKYPIKAPVQYPTKYPIKVVKDPTNTPVKNCNYICPLNSYPKDDDCPKDFDDCKCKDGYDESEYKDECIKEVDTYPSKSPGKNCGYFCPINSYPKDDDDCPKDFDDCKCKDGYDESEYKDECIKDN